MAKALLKPRLKLLPDFITDAKALADVIEEAADG